MWILIAIVIVLVLIVSALIYFANNSGEEQFRIQSRAYFSCDPLRCDKRFVTKNHLKSYNPFVWPYSATENPEDVLYDDPNLVAKVNPYGTEGGVTREQRSQETGEQTELLVSSYNSVSGAPTGPFKSTSYSDKSLHNILDYNIKPADDNYMLGLEEHYTIPRHSEPDHEELVA